MTATPHELRAAMRHGLCLACAVESLTLEAYEVRSSISTLYRMLMVLNFDVCSMYYVIPYFPTLNLTISKPSAARHDAISTPPPTSHVFQGPRAPGPAPDARRECTDHRLETLVVLVSPGPAPPGRGRGPRPPRRERDPAPAAWGAERGALESGVWTLPTPTGVGRGAMP